MRASADRAEAELVTTEKDFVRLPPDAKSAIAPISVRAEFENEISISKLLYEFRSEAVAHGG